MPSLQRHRSVISFGMFRPLPGTPTVMTTRRRFLSGSAAIAASTLLLRCSTGNGTARTPSSLPNGIFQHAVASGDPLPDRVMIWTRITVPRDHTGLVDVEWMMFADAQAQVVVASGQTRTDAERDFTVKVDVGNLAPGTRYFYGFRALGESSPTGRTRTAPAGSPEALNLAVITCGDYTRGLFHVYRRVAERDDLDAVIHLGDAIYEHGKTDKVRPHDPPVECRTVDEYRRRYASYREDADQAAMYQQHPVIWVWDDHETCDGTWMHGADPSNHDPDEDGDFEARKLAARQAVFEWMPIRLPDPANPERIYRRFAFGDLVDLFMLDTRRIGRDKQAESDEFLSEFGAPVFAQQGEFADPGRHILGAEQEQWLIDGLNSSRARWTVLGNQVVFSQLKLVGAPNATGLSLYLNPDQWDGYAAARERIFDAIEAANLRNLIVLTGDVHAAAACEISRDPNNPAVYLPGTGVGSLGVEFVTTSISSASDPKPPNDFDDALERLVVMAGDALTASNPHLRYVKAELNGYLLLNISAESLRAEFWTVPFVTEPTDEQMLDQRFTVTSGSPVLLPELLPPGS